MKSINPFKIENDYHRALAISSIKHSVGAPVVGQAVVALALGLEVSSISIAGDTCHIEHTYKNSTQLSTIKAAAWGCCWLEGVDFGVKRFPLRSIEAKAIRILQANHDVMRSLMIAICRKRSLDKADITYAVEKALGAAI